MIMNTEKKNLPESVYSRLKNVALTKKRPTQEVLQYFAMERFLYRLSVSKYKSLFFLKGGLMLMVWDPVTHRATIDIDLLAKANNSFENISQILKEICSNPVLQDGIEFNSADLILAESQIETEYTGLSARFSANLHTAKLPIKIDIGFSDKIFPEPTKIAYPSLLDFPSPELQGYTPETMIAEKLDAMVKLGLANSRMKDFYDIRTIINRFQIKSEKIAPIIKAVFQHRKTTIREVPKAFSEAFYKTRKTREQWDAFLKGIGHDPIPLEMVISELRDFFLPILPLSFDKESGDVNNLITKIKCVYLPLSTEKLFATRIVHLLPNEMQKLNETGNHWCESLEIINSKQESESSYVYDKMYEVVLFYVNGESGRGFVSHDYLNRNQTHTKLERAVLGETYLVPGYFLKDWNNRINASTGHLMYWFQPINNLPENLRYKLIARARSKLPYNLFD